jgi:hypothetical protein
VIVVLKESRGDTYGSDLLATAVTLCVSESNLKMIGEVMIIHWPKFVKEFF